MSRKTSGGRSQESPQRPETSMDELDTILAEVQSIDEQATRQPSGPGDQATGTPQDMPEEWNDPDLNALSEEISKAMEDDPTLQDTENLDHDRAAIEGTLPDPSADEDASGILQDDAAHDSTITENKSTDGLTETSDTAAADDATGAAEVVDSMLAELEESSQATKATASEVGQLQDEVLPDAQCDLDALLQSEPEEDAGESTTEPGDDAPRQTHDLPEAIDASIPGAPDALPPEQDPEPQTASLEAPEITDALNETFDQVRRSLESAMSDLQSVLQQVTQVQQEAVTRVHQAKNFKVVAQRALNTGRQFSQAHVDATRARSVYEDAQLQAESLRQVWEDAQRAATEAAGLLA